MSDKIFRQSFAALCLAAILSPALTTAMPVRAETATEAGLVQSGYRVVQIKAVHRAQPLVVHVWYPAQAGGDVSDIGANPLFQGVPSRANAPFPRSPQPLVLLSHGSGGSAANLGWIAAQLAAAGYIVAAPDHPGSTSGDSRQADTIRIWERPADLSAALDGLLADPDWSAAIDPQRISALGFSLGGYTVLAVAGARVTADAYARYCDAMPDTGGIVSDCAWMKAGRIDLHALDTVRFNRDNRDPRLTAAIAVDPALAQAFAPESLTGIKLPVDVINLGQPRKIPLAVAAAQVADAIPGARYQTLADAIHFSFLGECRANGAEILKAAGEPEPLCTDGGGRSRAAIHAGLAGMILAALARGPGGVPNPK